MRFESQSEGGTLVASAVFGRVRASLCPVYGLENGYVCGRGGEGDKARVFQWRW